MTHSTYELQRLWLARVWWISIGTLALLMGVVGIVLPGLPTTVFVLLAAYCFSKSSPRLHGWLTSHAFFGPIITDWHERGAIAPRYKAMAVGMMAALLCLSLSIGLALWAVALQALFILAAAAYILTRPSQ